MELNERDMHIIKPLLETHYKKIKKLAQNERSAFGRGFAFDELESYLGLMLDELDKQIELPENKKAFEERMERIKQ